jgi:hypothetical protein
MSEVTLDRAGGDKQGLGDLPVRKPFGSQFGDATLAGGECFEPRKQCSARPGPGCAQFGLGSHSQRFGTEVVGGVDCLVEKLTRLDAAVAATEEGPELSQSAGVFEASAGTGEDFDRLAQQDLAAIAADHKPGGPQGHAKSAWGSEGEG